MGVTTFHPKTLDSPVELPQVVEASEEVKNKPRKWYYYLWDTLDKPKEERWFMFKLDAALLTFASLGNFIRDMRCTVLILVLQVISSSTSIKQTLTALLCPV